MPERKLTARTSKPKNNNKGGCVNNSMFRPGGIKSANMRNSKGENAREISVATVVTKNVSLKN
jgi:hypothetical protein